MTWTPRRRRAIGVEPCEPRVLLTHILGIEHPSWLPQIPAPIDRASLSEEAWGEGGRIFYPAAAGVMSLRNLNRPEQQLTSSERAALRPFFGGLVDRVRVSYGADPLNEWGAPFGSKIYLGGEAASAQTYGLKIYVKDSRDSFEDRDRLRLLIHELVHSEQYERFGGSLANFGYHYFKGYKRANQVYEDNKLEVEANLRENMLIDDVYESYASRLQPQFCLVGTDAYTTFENNTGGELHYQFRWHPDRDWQSYTLSPGRYRTHYIDTRCGEIARSPEIRFDGSYDPGFQEKVYRLDYENRPDTIPRGGVKGKQYEFKPSGGDFDLFVRRDPPPPNRAPTLSSLGGMTIRHGQTLRFTALATDPDRNAINFSLSGAPDGAEIHEDSGEFSWTPDPSQGPGTYRLTVRATDNGAPNRSDSETITVEVLPGPDDRLEPNDSRGLPRDLGRLASRRVESGLILQDDDWYSFRTTRAGRADDFVKISFSHARGDLDLRLIGPDGTTWESQGTDDSEVISLDGKPAGTYLVQVFGYGGVTNPDYTLEIDPPSSAAGDYDGDGRADLALYRFDAARNTGVFEVVRSRDGGTLRVDLGGPGAIPVEGDFDGDGRADLAVVDPRAAIGGTTPNATVWTIVLSSRGFDRNDPRVVPFGAPGVLDRPAPADFDGDGVTDIATFRANSDLVPGAAQWFILPSSTGAAFAVIFGAPGGTDLPAPADFDGDGKADIAVFRPVSDLIRGVAQWFILPSAPNPGYRTTRGGFPVTFGAAGNADQPVVADFDGDGRADITAFRSSSDLAPGSAQWFVLPSAPNRPNYATTRGGFPVTFGRAGVVSAVGDYDGDGRPDLAVFDAGAGSWTIRRGLGGPDRDHASELRGGRVVPVLSPLYFRLRAAGALSTAGAPSPTGPGGTPAAAGLAVVPSAPPALLAAAYVGADSVPATTAGTIAHPGGRTRWGGFLGRGLGGLVDPLPSSRSPIPPSAGPAAALALDRNRRSS